ncbi:circadian clock-controlled protein daywake-like [Spodoptera frugiperda]|uniref:Circadian clock-controlled protein daywake-like n=1 Tax=Spodoptera frugiperda TaxID=7108 RepID=A0A9R0EQ55_SPOFR|nr:circadian clock-controlled protein daywake-like [Spodoptera frugiperda]
MVVDALFYSVALASVIGLTSAYSVSFRRPCRDLSPECLRKTVQAALPTIADGIPDLGIESLDPYELKKLQLKLPGIDIAFSNGYAKGLKTCNVDYASFGGGLFESQMHCNLTIKGKYRSSGRLLLFPINGDGESIIKCRNLKLHSQLQLGSVVRSDGRRYIDIKDSRIEHGYDGRVMYSMTNLFKGNPAMSNAVLDFMNSNWKMVAEEFGTPMVEFGVKSIMKNVKQLFDVLPIDELEKL